MSTLPLVTVTARIKDQAGKPVAGALVRMRLTVPEKYQGLIVPRETTQVTDASGNAALRVFPNALGYEGSEYDVHISFPGSDSGVCGAHSAPPLLRTIRAHAVVPNADCNLMDILNLPPYEHRGAGAVLPEEVAGYAAQAAGNASAAQSHAATAQAAKSEVAASATAAGAARDASAASASEAAGYVQDVKKAADALDDTICHFQNTVTDRVEKTAARLTADATACIKEREGLALEAIERRGGESLAEITATASAARTEALGAVATARDTAVHAVTDARDTAVDELREMAGLFEEDFLTLTERAESAAKRSGCSAAAAANEAAKACACATRAESAAQGLDLSNQAALTAANRAETAATCANADAQRAEAAADGVKINADRASGAAIAAQKYAQAADASADAAKVSADATLEARDAVAADRAVVAGIADDTKQAVLDAAAGIVTEEIIDAATAQATAEANAAKDAALGAQTAAERAKGEADTAKTGADTAKAGADTAQAEAEAAKGEAQAARDAAAGSALAAKDHADRAESAANDVDTNLEAAVPKPVWEGTKLRFANASGTITEPAVDVQGPKGDAATIAVGEVTALEHGETPVVLNAGTAHAATFNFKIPKGKAASVAVGTVSACAPGETPTVTNRGTASAAIFDFVVPKGDKGDGLAVSGALESEADLPESGAAGDTWLIAGSLWAWNTVTNSWKNQGLLQGAKGDAGTAATITMGSVSLVAPGEDPTVTNSGTTHAAVLDFVLPKGEVPPLTDDYTTTTPGAALSSAGAVALYGKVREGGAATEVPTPGAIPKAGADGKIAQGWLPAPLVAPVITFPAPGGTVPATGQITMTIAPFSLEDTHVNTDWVVSEDEERQIVVVQSLGSTDLLTHSFPAQDLTIGNTYYLHARQNGSVTKTSWATLAVKAVRFSDSVWLNTVKCVSTIEHIETVYHNDSCCDDDRNLYVVGEIAGAKNAVICKFDEDGSLLWGKRVSSYLLYSHVTITPVGVLAVGTTTTIGVNEGSHAIVLHMYDRSGNVLWQRRCASHYVPSVKNVFIDNLGNIYIAMEYFPWNKDNIDTSGVLLLFSPVGERIFAKIFYHSVGSGLLIRGIDINAEGTVLINTGGIVPGSQGGSYNQIYAMSVKGALTEILWGTWFRVTSTGRETIYNTGLNVLPDGNLLLAGANSAVIEIIKLSADGIPIWAKTIRSPTLSKPLALPRTVVMGEDADKLFWTGTEAPLNDVLRFGVISMEKGEVLFSRRMVLPKPFSNMPYIKSSIALPDSQLFFSSYSGSLCKLQESSVNVVFMPGSLLTSTTTVVTQEAVMSSSDKVVFPLIKSIVAGTTSVSTYSIVDIDATVSTYPETFI